MSHLLEKYNDLITNPQFNQILCLLSLNGISAKQLISSDKQVLTFAEGNKRKRFNVEISLDDILENGLYSTLKKECQSYLDFVPKNPKTLQFFDDDKIIEFLSKPSSLYPITVPSDSPYDRYYDFIQYLFFKETILRIITESTIK